MNKKQIEKKAIVRKEANGVYVENFNGKGQHFKYLGKSPETEIDRMFKMINDFFVKGIDCQISLLIDHMKGFKIKLIDTLSRKDH